MEKSNLKTTIKSYVFIIFGLFLYAFSWSAFLLPQHLTGGGTSGVAALIYFATGLPTGISIILINAIFIIAAIKTIGLKFGINSIFGVVGISFFFLILDGVFDKPLVEDQFMCTLIAAGLSAAATAITFVNGGNTGGVDILALIITKYKNISPGRVILYHDLIVIASSYLIFHSIEKIVYGYVVMGVFSYMLDLILAGQRQSYQFMIFSHQAQLIASKINEFGRGVTILHGYGFYSKQDMEVVVVIARKTDYQGIMTIISQCDKNAFISVAKVSGVFGQNFDEVKK